MGHWVKEADQQMRTFWAATAVKAATGFFVLAWAVPEPDQQAALRGVPLPSDSPYGSLVAAWVRKLNCFFSSCFVFCLFSRPWPGWWPNPNSRISSSPNWKRRSLKTKMDGWTLTPTHGPIFFLLLLHLLFEESTGDSPNHSRPNSCSCTSLKFSLKPLRTAGIPTIVVPLYLYIIPIGKFRWFRWQSMTIITGPYWRAYSARFLWPAPGSTGYLYSVNR